ncbi:MAG: MBL fold metallo-hydrolase [Thermoplasmata archaeon]|nr:MAG: MBL fold metallo-hydrolase [Thermoplasmata archaeon]
MIKKKTIGLLIIIAVATPVKARDIEATRITQDVIVIHGGGGNTTVARTDSGIIVVDSFVSPQAAREAKDIIIKYFPDIPIKYLINTHYHSDHVRGNQHFRDALIIGHANLEKHMMDDYDQLIKKYGSYDEKIMELENRINEVTVETGEAAHKLKEDSLFLKEAKTFLEEFIPTPPSLHITSDSILTIGGKIFEILYFGTAHTDNDLVILSREDQLLIMVDLLFHRNCYIINSTSDVKNWISILDKMIKRSAEYKYVIPGHGAVVVDANALVEQRDYLNIIWNTVTDARHRGLTLDQIKKEIKLDGYKEFIDYDKIGLDIEACWHQLER